jgi:hypothetical protein
MFNAPWLNKGKSPNAPIQDPATAARRTLLIKLVSSLGTTGPQGEMLTKILSPMLSQIDADALRGCRDMLYTVAAEFRAIDEQEVNENA